MIETTPFHLLLRARLHSRISPEGVAPGKMAAVARALMPVSAEDASGPRGVWRCWIETVEAAAQDAALMKRPAFHHAMSRLLAVAGVCMALDDPDVAGTIAAAIALSSNPHVA